MTNTVLSPPPVPGEPRHRRWLPFGDRSRSTRLAKVLGWLAGIALVLVVLELLGVDVLGWFSDLWDALAAIGFGYLVAGWTLQTVKTALTAFAWYSILHVAFPSGRVLGQGGPGRSDPRPAPGVRAPSRAAVARRAG